MRKQWGWVAAGALVLAVALAAYMVPRLQERHRIDIVFTMFNGSMAEARGALASGAVDPNVRLEHGRTLLHIAVGRNDAERVALLLEMGADPNAPNDYGERPLHGAASGLKLDVAEALLEGGADPNAGVAGAGSSGAPLDIMYGSNPSSEYEAMETLLRAYGAVSNFDANGETLPPTETNLEDAGP